jgi:hypothetical protein
LATVLVLMVLEKRGSGESVLFGQKLVVIVA